MVLQLPGAQNLTNRYYAVHPRRNDRFLRAAAPLRALYPEVDFTEFHFNRHLLQDLYSVDAQRFESLAEELRLAWVARMAEMIRRLPCPVVLLWLSVRPPPLPGVPDDPFTAPVLVDAGMIQALQGMVADAVEVVGSPAARAEGVSGWCSRRCSAWRRRSFPMRRCTGRSRTGWRRACGRCCSRRRAPQGRPPGPVRAFRSVPGRR